MKLKLGHVSYEAYERGVKRYGYTGRLTDQTLREVKTELHLNPEELRDRDSLTHFYYQSEQAFDHGNYHTQQLLVLGFLLC